MQTIQPIGEKIHSTTQQMSKQSEQVLEEQLLAQLQKLGYGLVIIKDEAGLIANLKTQLEKHNNCTFSKTEFEKVINLLSKGSVFEKGKTLRERQHIVRDDSTNLYFEFLNTEHWCQNQYQVTHQVSQEGRYKNRYDVTLLINGLPLVQIELKRKGLELKEAFNQINRYQRHSFGASAASRKNSENALLIRPSNSIRLRTSRTGLGRSF